MELEFSQKIYIIFKLKRTRGKINLAVRVHDLKHPFGRRLRSAGVSLEDRQDLLRHKSGKITTHYPATGTDNLIAAINKVCNTYQPKQL